MIDIMNIDFCAVLSGLTTAFCVLLYFDLRTMTQKVHRLEIYILHFGIEHGCVKPKDPK